MAQDQVANFGMGQRVTGLTAAATSVVLESGQGARFPDPASGEYNVVIWDTLYNSAAEAYHASAAEIGRATAKSSDTFTVTRAQEGTTARAFNTSGHTYNFELNLTAKILDDLTTRAGDDVYVASITQAGTDDPVATVIKSTLSAAIVWTRTSSGVYLGTLTGAFVAGKTTVDPHGRDTTTSLPLTMDGYYVSTATVQLITFEQDGWTATVTIRVYPS